MEIREFTRERLEDVLAFERALRAEEDFWGWEIDDAYIAAVSASFDDPDFANSVTLLAYMDGKVVGRIDSAIICSRFDGGRNAYLDWLCVIKSYRHRGVAQAMMKALREELKARGVHVLIALTAADPEAQRFYRALPNAELGDEGIRIEIQPY